MLFPPIHGGPKVFLPSINYGQHPPQGLDEEERTEMEEEDDDCDDEKQSWWIRMRHYT